MTDIVIVCDNAGRKLTELPVSIEREYPSLDRNINAGSGSFAIPAGHAKATGRFLRYGNLIYVYSDQVGIPDWAAMIWPSEPAGTRVRDGELVIQLRSVEWLLATRATEAQDILSGKSGRIFQGLLNIARREGYLPITTDTNGIAMGGAVSSKEYNLMSVYEAVNRLAEDNEVYWSLLPFIDSTNTLQLRPQWRFKRTSNFRGKLDTGGTNANFAITDLGEAVEIANHVIAYGRSDSWASPVMYQERSRPSISRYRQVYTKVLQCLDETTVEGLIPIVKAYLKTHAFPPLYAEGIVTRAPFPKVGDVTDLTLSDYGGVITDQRGSNVKMQVQTAAYSPGDSSLAIRVEEIIQ